MAGFRKPGRDIKRKFARTAILKVRISPEFKDLIAALRKDADNKIISDADIVEFSLAHYGKLKNLYWNEKKKEWGDPW